MLKPHYFFLIVGFIFGTLFLVLTFPFQVPDEVNHFNEPIMVFCPFLTGETYLAHPSVPVARKC